MSKQNKTILQNRHQLFFFLIIASIFHFAGCAAQKAYNRGVEESKHGDYDRAAADFLVALNKKPDNPSYRTHFERARLSASEFHFQKAKQLLEGKNYEQAIIEYQYALSYNPSNQFVANELEHARVLYDKEQNKDRLTAIEKAKEEAKKNSLIYKALGPEAEKVIQSLKFHDDSLKHILDSLGAVVGINVVYDSDFRDQEFSVSLDNITFRNALDQILVANHLYYKPLDQSTILIVPDNPQKRRQYDEQVIQTFYLSNAELNDVLNLIRSVMQIQRIATNPQLNAITLRDTPDKIAIAQKIIEANDKARSEILLDIEILEIDRDQAMTYGIDLSAYQITQSLIVNGTTAGQIFGNQLGSIDTASWSFSVPSIIYNALASDQRTKILAKPQIRASEGQQVTVRLGDRVPIQVTTVAVPGTVPGTPTGVVATRTFQQQDIGINIDVTPRVHHNREISLTMRFELTSITAPGTIDIPPTIGNRTVNTVIRLKDGETNLLAGLLRRDERKSLRGLPGIINIPLIKELFASNDKELQERDIVFTITPHILRTPDITEKDLSPIWIGTEDDVRLKAAPPISVFERAGIQQETPWTQSSEIDQENGDVTAPEPVSGGETTTPPPVTPQPPTQQPQPQPQGTHPAAVPVPVPVPVPTQQPNQTQESSATVAPQPGTEPAPAEPQQDAAKSVAKPVAPSSSQQPQTSVAPSIAPPVAPPMPADMQQGESATISFNSPNQNPKAGSEFILHIELDNADHASNLSMILHFDPSMVQVTSVNQGPLFAPGAFSKSFDNGRGVISINANRQQTSSTSGNVADIVLHTVKPGQTTIGLESSVLRDSNGGVIRITFLPFTFKIQ